MASEINLPVYGDHRGKLTVVEKILPFSIKRVYYIYSCNSESRGGHRHKKTIQALICIVGSCIVDWNNGSMSGTSVLDSPTKVLLVQPEDFHIMRDFSTDAVLLVLASEYFDPNDYIDEDYSR